MIAFGTKETNIRIDWLSTLLMTLLKGSLLTFIIGYFSYQYDWIIITMALVVKQATNSRKMTAYDPERHNLKSQLSTPSTIQEAINE
jgi:hypothetical protein